MPDPSPLSTAITPKDQLRRLMEADRPEALVRSQPGEELYLAIMDVGLADAADVVQLVGPQQFRTLLDLGGWKRDRIDPHRVLTWLRAARGDSLQDFFEKFDALDVEMVEVVLRAFTEIHDLEEDPDVAPEHSYIETAERRYLVEIKAEGVEEAAVRRLLEDMMARDPFQFTRLIEALRWELQSELEETAYRFRSGRLEDLGFPPLEEAMRLFTYVKPDPNAPAPAPSDALAGTKEVLPWLDEAAAGLTAEESVNWQHELRHLVNSVLVAEGTDAGDLHGMRSAGAMVRDYLGFGLQRLTGGDITRATEVLRDTPSIKLFQLGFSETLPLKHRADALVRAVGGTLVLMPFEAKSVAALARRRPLRALRVEGAEPVPFRSHKEIWEAQGIIIRAESQHALLSRMTLPPAEKLPVTENEETPAERTGRAVMTALANVALERGFITDALSSTQLAKLSAAIANPTFGERAEEALKTLAKTDSERDEATRLAQECVERMRSELARWSRVGATPGIEIEPLLRIQR